MFFTISLVELVETKAKLHETIDKSSNRLASRRNNRISSLNYTLASWSWIDEFSGSISIEGDVWELDDVEPVTNGGAVFYGVIERCSIINWNPD